MSRTTDNIIEIEESGESHSHSLIRSRFTFDESEDFPIFNGWYDPTYRYWNGWSNPYFDKPTRDSFLAYQKSFVGQIIDEVDKEFFDYFTNIKPKVIDGKELYYFGSWICWTEL